MTHIEKFNVSVDEIGKYYWIDVKTPSYLDIGDLIFRDGKFQEVVALSCDNFWMIATKDCPTIHKLTSGAQLVTLVEKG